MELTSCRSASVAKGYRSAENVLHDQQSEGSRQQVPGRCHALDWDRPTKHALVPCGTCCSATRWGGIISLLSTKYLQASR